MWPFVYIVRKLKTNINKCHLLCFTCKVVSMDYGMKEQNPIDKVHFYCKADPSKAVKITKEQVGFYFPSEKHFHHL